MSCGFYKLDPKATFPVRENEDVASWSLHALHDIKMSQGIINLRTGIGIVLPEGYCARIYPSVIGSWNIKQHIVTPTLIEKETRDEIRVLIVVVGDHDLELKQGQEIARLVLEKVDRIPMGEIPVPDPEPESDDGYPEDRESDQESDSEDSNSSFL